jgi:glycosyltransferase involved in cell wall biosynthesis
VIEPKSGGGVPRIAVVSEQIRPVELDAELPSREQYALELTIRLARMGAQADLFVRRIDDRDARITVLEPGARLITVPAGAPGPRPRRTLWMVAPQMRDQILRFMVAEGTRYDLVHGATWVAGIAAADVAKRAGLAHTQLIQAPNGAKQHHVDDPHGSPPQRVQFEQDLARDADALIARTPSEREHLVRAYGADPARVVVVPWGLDLERFRPGDRAQARRKLGLEQTGSIVLHAGRPEPRCGLHDLLRALTLLGDLPGGTPQLLVVGGDVREPSTADTPQVGELWQLAAELGVNDRVRFVGRRSRTELPEYYAAADVVAWVPSHEPYGSPVREAMACARPAVGSAVGGIADVLATVQAGALVSPEDPRDLAAKLRRLLRSPGLRARLGRAGRAYAERELGWNEVAARHLELFRRVAGIAEGEPPRAAVPQSQGSPVPARRDAPPA